MTEPTERLLEYIRSDFLRDKPGTPLNGDTLLVQEGIIDSLGIFVLISFLEKELHTQLQPEDIVIENFETINKLAALVQLRKAG